MRTSAAGMMILLGLLAVSAIHGQAEKPAPGPDAKTLGEARTKGTDWLTKNQAADGSWGKTYSIAITSFACLAYLGSADEPFDGDHGKALTKGLLFLLANQTDGMVKSQGHSWIHGQGFCTLALSEAYGRSLFCKIKPDIDTAKLKDAAAKGVKVIAKHQSHSGGWWYTPDSPTQHEGSTTVCAVQAIVSATNFKLADEEKVLDKGFEYLKKCQTDQGGFNYQLGDGSNMHPGTAAAVATLGLMQKFDFQVMINGFNFLLKIEPKAISNSSFPYYGHFYGAMGMQLLWQEYKDDKSFDEKTKGYLGGTFKELLTWQEKDGSWGVRGWVAGANETAAYGTGFALMALAVPDGRISIYNRTPPKLPEEKK